MLTVILYFEAAKGKTEKNPAEDRSLLLTECELTAQDCVLPLQLFFSSSESAFPENTQ